MLPGGKRGELLLEFSRSRSFLPDLPVAEESAVYGFDKDRLIDRVVECRSNGAVLDLSDPRLMGLEPRPLDRSRW